MTDKTYDTTGATKEQKPLKIESILPVKAVGIESIKEGHAVAMSPHRRLYRWFARRPTAATRLAILASILPEHISDDQLLDWMRIGPRAETKGSLKDYVVKKYATKDDRSGSVEDHFGYDYPHRSVPSEQELEGIHDILREHWDGELPTILDPTAGGGTIPFEALRYGLPTISNELNPVAWLLNKIILEYAPTQGSLEEEFNRWASQIQALAEEQLQEYYPERNGVKPGIYFCSYSIGCPSCGDRYPISNKWWFNRPRGIAIRPIYDEENLRYDMVNVPDDVPKSEFNPSEGTISGGDAECPHCGVVTKRDELTDIFSDGDFEYEVCGVRYEQEINGTKFHPPTEADRKAIARAAETVSSNLDLATLLSQQRYVGYYDRSAPYGVTEWRDLFSPRQLLAHATYLDAFSEVKEEIQSEYDEDTAEAILVLLTSVSARLVNRNSRLEPVLATRGSVSTMLGNNNFSFQWQFGESNLTAGSYSYQSEASHIIEHYEEVVNYVSHIDDPDVQVQNGDAANLPQDNESIEAVVIDPPYGDNVMYAEVSDAFYVWFREYLSEIFPTTFSSPDTDKHNEATENPVIVQPDDGESVKQAARERYENKMRDIFSEAYRVLERGGVLTIYFTDKEIDAWDSLTMSLIRSGFVITSTHTITSEMPDRIGVKEDASADSTLLLTCRKPTTDPSSRQPTLWSDIRSQTRNAARQKAAQLFNANYNLTKTDTIISSFGPTLKVYTENYPVVDDKDNNVRPKEALREARTAVIEVLVERELEGSLDNVDSLTTWYLLSWLVYEQESIPHDEARQLGLGVGVEIDEIKRDTKIWSKSKDQVVLASQSDRVQDYTELESGGKRRTRKYPVDPREMRFENNIDAVHAALNVLETKGAGFTLKWFNERSIQNDTQFRRTLRSLIQVLPEDHPDYRTAQNLIAGQTGEYLDVSSSQFDGTTESKSRKQTRIGDHESE